MRLERQPFATMQANNAREHSPSMTAPSPEARPNWHTGPSPSPDEGRCGVRPVAALVLVAAFATACSYPYPSPKLPVSDQHLTAGRAAAADDILPPVVTPSLPPPRPQQKLPTYSVVVNEVPLKDLLFALARDTKQNIDIHPALTGLVSLNAIDETLPSILERISRQVNIRWKQEGRTLTVMPDTPYVKAYRVNYVNVTRETDSTVSVSGQIGTTTGAAGAGGAGAAAGGAGAGGAGGNTSSATVTTRSRNDFWETLERNVKSMLMATRAQSMSADERASRAEAAKALREERIAQAEAVARAGDKAKDLFASVFEGQQQGTALPGDVTNEVVVNPISGTVSVLATERQHRLVQEYLDSVSVASQRQVLIEATIVEVELSRTYQAGVDWGRVAASPGAGIEFSQNLLGATRLATAPVTALTYGSRNQSGVFAAIKMLEQFGTTRVLSSPKVMALNNQTALLKVVRNLVYFQVQQQISQATSIGGQNLQATTTTARTVPIGLVMSLTPQINEAGAVSLTVRPTVTSQVGTAIDPNPALTTVRNEIPVVEIREIESVLQLSSGQTAILGGLIRDEVRRNRDQIPGVGNTRVGDLFAYRNESAVKTELVIFLRPTVVKTPSVEAGDLRFLRSQLPAPGQFDATGPASRAP
jgi:general secretion pathway protein D